jgi:hypothetical protein
MQEKLRFLGLDVHAETIAIAIAEPDGEVRSLGTIPNRTESIRKLIKKLGPAEKLRACYEAGPTGYVVYWQLAELGVQCTDGLLRCRTQRGFQWPANQARRHHENRQRALATNRRRSCMELSSSPPVSGTDCADDRRAFPKRRRRLRGKRNTGCTSAI